MTTGRINQVTILSQRAETQRQPPEGSELYQARRRRSAPNRHSIAAKGNNSVSDRFNCPHWVPQKLVRSEPCPTLPSQTLPLHTAFRRRKRTPCHA